MEENIIGGVSPMKRRGKSRGKGRRGTGDTRYKRDKWQKPTSGGTTTIPKRKMGELPPPPEKPYKIKDGKVVPNITNNYNYGDNTINQNMINNPSTKTTTKTTKGKPGTDPIYKDVTSVTTWQQGWDKMEDVEGGKKKNKFGRVFDNLEDFKVAGREYNKRTGHTTRRTDKVLVKEGTEATPDTVEEITESTSGNNGNQFQTATINAPGKYKLGGYRTMKKNKK